MINCRRCGRPYRWFFEAVYARGMAALTCPYCEFTMHIDTVELPREGVTR